ncbi:Uncharacterised protein [Mycobacteroides abscessus subsp. abscessus]|nr:Uncharacterised protein [Mycobacteroides abscessus subsp. abscessus]
MLCAVMETRAVVPLVLPGTEITRLPDIPSTRTVVALGRLR